MVDSVKNAISRIETPKAQKADSQSDRGAKGSISAQSRTAAGSSDSVQLKSVKVFLVERANTAKTVQLIN